MNEMQPAVEPGRVVPEITVKVMVISIVLALILSMSNAYLALKIGILTSASIPAAILAFGILKFFRKSNILENNLIQTAASAGEAVAGGIVYTIPALILIHYWKHFPYWECFFIAFTSGALGVLFSIPLRRILVNDETLHFPEGKAIAEVLIVGTYHQLGLKEILFGGFLGGFIELFQVGFKLIASQWQWFVLQGRTLMVLGMGFSPTMIGAGYLIGFEVGVSLFFGALLGWGLCLPLLSHWMTPVVLPLSSMTDTWQENIRYVGVGAMLVAGLWILFTLLKPVGKGLRSAFQLVKQPYAHGFNQLRTERDLPIHYVIVGSFFFLTLIFLLLQQIFPFSLLHTLGLHPFLFSLGVVIYIAVVGFIVCTITGYFSGLVGVSASPGSAVLIACLLITCLLLKELFHASMGWSVMAAIPIFIGSLLTGIGAIANDNLQDLKVGQLVGATPWKQQVMLLLGVLVAAFVIPWVMELLFNVYGIGDVLPHEGMSLSQALPAPPAAMMAALSEGVFDNELPWHFLWCGALLGGMGIVVTQWFHRKNKNFSILAFAMGIYLPLSTSMALAIGSFLGKGIELWMKKRDKDFQERASQKTVIFACGLVAGAALMDVLLAIPFAWAHNPDVWRLLPMGWNTMASLLSVGMLLGLGICFWRIAVKS